LIAASCPGADEEAVLDELVAAGSVEVIEGTTVRCLSRAYVPKGADVKRIERMGRFLSVVSANFVHNLLREGSEPLYFERAVVSDELISEAGRDKFLALAGERGQELLTELDTFLTQLAAKERSESGKRYGVGVYFFEDEPHDGTGDLQGKDADTDRKTDRSVSPVEEIDVLAGMSRKQ
jgi:hypothetical protein